MAVADSDRSARETLPRFQRGCQLDLSARSAGEYATVNRAKCLVIFASANIMRGVTVSCEPCA